MGEALREIDVKEVLLDAIVKFGVWIALAGVFGFLYWNWMKRRAAAREAELRARMEQRRRKSGDDPPAG